MGKRIYVAGASANIEEIESYIKKLKGAGWTISFDWTVKVREAGDASPDDPVIRRQAALADLEGVTTADVVWLVQPAPTSTSTGAWVELGSALTIRDVRKWVVERFKLTLPEGLPVGPIVVASGSSKKCIFSDLADYRFQSNDDAFDFINKKLW